MDKIKSLKLKNPDGTISDNIPFNIDGINVDLMNGKNLEEELNYINEKIDNIPVITVDIVTEINEDSTDDEVPSAKCMYNLLGDVESLLDDIIGEGE